MYAAERAVNTADLNWRVMAQVSLGEVLACSDARAYSAINSKRVDLLIVSSSGDPIAAIEYQGHGHYQGTAAARDAIKKEALRKAGVRYIEVTPDSGTEEMVRVISRIAQVERLKQAPVALMRDAGTVTVIEARDDGDVEGHPPSTSSTNSSISSISKHDAPSTAASPTIRSSNRPPPPLGSYRT